MHASMVEANNGLNIPKFEVKAERCLKIEGIHYITV